MISMFLSRSTFCPCLFQIMLKNQDKMKNGRNYLASMKFSADPVSLSAEDLQLLCQCELELATVADQRLLTITAARHIVAIMKKIEKASSLEDNEVNEYEFTFILF